MLDKNQIKIKEALEKATTHHEVTLQRASDMQALEKELELIRGGEKYAADAIEAKCNELLIANATKVIRALLENDAVREYVEKNMGSDGSVTIGEKEIFITLAEFCPEVPEVEVHLSLEIYGRPHSTNSFQLVLQVHRSQENGYEWDYSTVQYCVYSIDQILCENWMDATPINLAPSIARALLYLQTPETAIQILVEQFHGPTKKKVGHKNRPPLLTSESMKDVSEAIQKHINKTQEIGGKKS